MLALLPSLLWACVISSHLEGLFLSETSFSAMVCLVMWLTSVPFFKLQQILQTFQQPPKPQSPALDNAVMAQVQALTAQLKTAPTPPPEQKATAFDKVTMPQRPPARVCAPRWGRGVGLLWGLSARSVVCAFRDAP